MFITANVPKKYEHIDFKPPQGVADAAERGLELRKEQSGDKAGLTAEEASEQGIGSGVQRATNLKNRTNVSPEVIGQMVGFFARHGKNIAKARKLTTKEEQLKSNMYVSDLLWGGEPGERWANKVKEQMEAADEKEKNASLASRVASRYLKAGKLEPPPVMFDKALKWFQGRIARRMEDILDLERDKVQAPDPSSQYEDAPMSPMEIKIAVNELLKLKAMFRDMGNEDMIYQREETIDTSQGPLKVKLLPSNEALLSYGPDTLTTPLDDFRFQQTVGPWIRKTGITSRRVSRDYQDKMRRFEGENLTYEQREARLKELSEVEAMFRPWKGNDRGIDNPLDVELDGWYRELDEFTFKDLPPLSMKLTLSRGEMNGGFISVSDDPLVMIDMPNDVSTRPGARELVSKLEDLLRHEMRHYAQYLFRLYRDIEERGSMYGNEVGLPHSLRTLEYDTIVADEITELRRYLKHVPGDMHPVVFKAWTHALTSRDRDDLKRYMVWVKQNPRHAMPSRFTGAPIDPTQGREFFRLMKDHDLAKWKRAVKTLARNVKMGKTAQRAANVVRRLLAEKLPHIASVDPKFAYDLYRQEDLNRGNNSSRREYPTTDLMSRKVLKSLDERIEALSDKIERYQDQGVDHSGLWDDREDLMREREDITRFLKDTLGFKGK
jgi:hypothetical protein